MFLFCLHFPVFQHFYVHQIDKKEAISVFSFLVFSLVLVIIISVLAAAVLTAVSKKIKSKPVGQRMNSKLLIKLEAKHLCIKKVLCTPVSNEKIFHINRGIKLYSDLSHTLLLKIRKVLFGISHQFHTTKQRCSATRF